MSVKITLEFKSAEEAIVALGKLAELTPREAKREENRAKHEAQREELTKEVEKKVRKPRADKGQPREPYGPRAQEATAPANAAEKVAEVEGTPVTPPATTVAAQAPEAVAPQTAAPEQTAVAPEPKAQTPAAAVPSLDDVQKAVEKLFTAKGYKGTEDLLARFGVKRGRDLRQDHRADFIRRVDGVVDNGEAI